MWYLKLKKKTCISRHIRHQQWYSCPIALPARRNRSTEVFWLLSQPLPHLVWHHQQLSNVLEKIYRPVVNRFTRQTLPTVNRKYFFVNILCIPSFCPQKRTTKLCSSVIHSSRTIAILTTKTLPLNMHMRVCYLACFEAGLCYYLVIHIENLLRPLQLFCFHLWPIHWLSFVVTVMQCESFHII
jgi:hypothetical protein